MWKVRFFFLLLCAGSFSSAQEKKPIPFSVDINYFYGNVLEHSPDIAHLITEHPRGVLFSYNYKTLGKEIWQGYYNYPEVGLSLLYQDMKNPHLGENYGLFAHLGFYFLKRKLMLRVGTGISYNTNPYDRDENFRNNAYGTHLMNNTFLMLNYKQKLFDKLSIQTGILLIHYSNGNFKAPNTSTNTFGLNLGMEYSFHEPTEYIPLKKPEEEKYPHPFHFNFMFRSGFHSSDVIGSGEYPFYVFSFFADKRISHKSTLLAGTELFLSEMLKEYIYFRSVAYPEEPVSGDEDSKRVGVFAGYQLNVGRIKAYVNLGYYVYYPFDFEGRTYNRLGLNYSLTENWFVGASVKSHAAKAEAVEFSVGYRL